MSLYTYEIQTYA